MRQVFLDLFGPIPMKQTDPQFKLRIPEDLKLRIESSAHEHGRSMNAEIVARLEGSFVSTAIPRDVVEFAHANGVPEEIALTMLIQAGLSTNGSIVYAVFSPGMGAEEMSAAVQLLRDKAGDDATVTFDSRPNTASVAHETRSKNADQDLWQRIAVLERKRSSLQIELDGLRQIGLQIAEQLSEAVEENKLDKLKELRNIRLENSAKRYRLEQEIAHFGLQLADLYDEASVDAPGTSGRHKIVKARYE